MNNAAQNSLIEQIHKQALEIASRHKSSEADLIDVLQKVERHKVYLAYLYRSLFHYATSGLGLSDDVAYAFITIARKAREIPALKEEIKSGALSVMKAKRIAPVLTRENQTRWLDLAKTKSKQQLEREIAMASPRHAVTDMLRYVHPSEEKAESVEVLKLGQAVRVQLQAGISEQVMMKLRRAQELISQRLRRPARLEEVLRETVAEYLERHCPLKIAERQLEKGRLSLRKRVFLKFEGQCAHREKNGERCGERRFLEVHHIKPRSEGGKDELGNLTLLCSGHHRMIHHA